MSDEKKLQAVFFRTDTGTEPVRDWLKGLSKKERVLIGVDLKTVEFGWPIGMPPCRHLGGGLWGIRSGLTHGRIARVVFCVSDGRMILLHGLVKKTQKTPQPDLELARRRQNEVER